MVMCVLAFAQPITTYPYLEDFETFPQSIAGSGAVAEPNPNAFPNSWTNDVAGDDAQDWYSVSGGTPSGGTGPVGDHTTGSGIYLYVEDSGGGANNDSVILFSPFFDLSSLPNARLGFFVHSDALGAPSFTGDSSYNDLKIDYFNGAVWTNIDSIGVLNTGWTERILDISSLPSIVRFRFRVNNNNYGDFIHDIAIDDVSVYDQPVIDGAIITSGISLTSPANYTIAPLSQSPSYEVSGNIQNRGLMTLTNLEFSAAAAGYADTVTVDSLQSFEDSTVTFSMAFAPSEGGMMSFGLASAENDTFPDNNAAMVAVSDTVFSRDDSTSSGGLGFTGGTGIFGNMFELTQGDVLTSFSFFLNSSTIGDSIRVWLYGYGNDLPNEPDTTMAMDSTDFWVVPSLGWHTLSFDCQWELPAGQYFIAVEQWNTNNLGFGYDLDNYTPDVAFFGDGVTRWVELGGAVPSLASAFIIRMNFGEAQKNAGIDVASDQICIGESITLTASGAPGTYTWTGNGLDTTGGTTVVAMPASTETYMVSLVDANGCTSSDSLVVNVNPLPTVSLDSTLAFFGLTNGTATATPAGGSAPYTYEWNDSSAQTTATATGLAPGTYTVVVTDSLGCSVVDSIMVTEAATGIDNLIDENLISVYPNPTTSGTFKVSNLEVFGMNEELTIKVMNVNGTVIQKIIHKGTNELDINLPDTIANGVYLIEINGREKRALTRVLIAR